MRLRMISVVRASSGAKIPSFGGTGGRWLHSGVVVGGGDGDGADDLEWRLTLLLCTSLRNLLFRVLVVVGLGSPRLVKEV